MKTSIKLTLYLIINRSKRAAYVGITTQRYPKRRLQKHLNLLKNNNHSIAELQQDFNSQGEGAFAFILLQEFEQPESLDKAEYDAIEHIQQLGWTTYNKVAGGIPHIQYIKDKIRFERKNAKHIKATLIKNAKLYVFRKGNNLVMTDSLKAFAGSYNLTASCLSRVARGLVKHHKGWTGTIYQKPRRMRRYNFVQQTDQDELDRLLK